MGETKLLWTEGVLVPLRVIMPFAALHAWPPPCSKKQMVHVRGAAEPAGQQYAVRGEHWVQQHDCCTGFQS